MVGCLRLPREQVAAKLAQAIREECGTPGLPSSNSRSRPGMGNSTPQYDENVQFSVYRPKVVCPAKWYTLLAFMHLADRPNDATPEELDPLEEVEKQVRQILGPNRVALYRKTTTDSSQACPDKGKSLSCPGSREWNSIHFGILSFGSKTYTGRSFVCRPRPSWTARSRTGQMSVFLGAILLADVELNVRVSSRDFSESQEPARETSSGRPYDKIFASYSHQDVAIVEQVEHYVGLLGHRYLRDWKDLRAGERWSDRLKELMAEADVFHSSGPPTLCNRRSCVRNGNTHYLSTGLTSSAQSTGRSRFRLNCPICPRRICGRFTSSTSAVTKETRQPLLPQER